MAGQIEERVDSPPATGSSGSRSGSTRAAGFGHRLDRHLDAQVQGLAGAGVDDRHLPVRADEEATDLLERVLCGAQADALHGRRRTVRGRGRTA